MKSGEGEPNDEEYSRRDRLPPSIGLLLDTSILEFDILDLDKDD